MQQEKHEVSDKGGVRGNSSTPKQTRIVSNLILAVSEGMRRLGHSP